MARCTSARNAPIRSSLRTGWTALLSSTTAIPSSRAISSEVPVKPVCQIVPSGQSPQAAGSNRQPSTRGSAPAPARRAVISARVPPLSTGCRSGVSSALANRPRSSAVPNNPACPLTPPSANALPSCTCPQTTPPPARWSPSASVAAMRSSGTRGRYPVEVIPSGPNTSRSARPASGSPAHSSTAQPSSMKPRSL